MEFAPSARDDALARLRRAEGQVRAVQRMLDEGEDCKKILTQLSAASAALERTGFRLFAAGMQSCLQDPESDPDMSEMEELFVKLS